MPLNAMIIGHSIPRRLDAHLKSNIDARLRSDFGLDESLAIKICASGGLTLKRMQTVLKKVRQFRPDCVVILLGDNDVRPAKFDTSPEEIAAGLISLVSLLQRRYSVGSIVLCQLLPRFSKHRHWKMYNHKAKLVNDIIKRDLSYSYASFWTHNGKFRFPIEGKGSKDKFLEDGVHLNDKGQYYLYKSLRGALQKCLSLLHNIYCQ